MAEPTPESPKEKRKRKRRRPSKRFWHDARLVAFTAILTSGLTTLSTYLLNKSQLREQNEHEVAQDKRRIHAEFERVFSDYKSAVIARQMADFEDKLEQLIAKSSLWEDVRVFETNGALLGWAGKPPTVNYRFEKRNANKVELQRRLFQTDG